MRHGQLTRIAAQSADAAADDRLSCRSVGATAAASPEWREREATFDVKTSVTASDVMYRT